MANIHFSINKFEYCNDSVLDSRDKNTSFHSFSKLHSQNYSILFIFR